MFSFNKLLRPEQTYQVFYIC